MDSTVAECLARSDRNAFLTLHPYQRDGLQWMLRRELNADEYGIRGGVLADDMGLGKTIQVLSLVHSGLADRGMTLIVVPPKLIDQWAHQCEQFTGVKPCVIQVSTVCETTYDRLRNEKIVLATHSCFNSSAIFDDRDDDARHVLQTIKFQRLVVDEAHLLKNERSLLFTRLTKVHARRRWAMTGSPIVGRLKDLSSLVQFLAGEIDSGKGKAMCADEDAVARMIFRRSKSDIQTDAFQLQPLTIALHVVEFSGVERRQYARHFSSGRRVVSGDFLDGDSFRDLLRIITRMRQACVCRSKLNALVECFERHPRGTRSLVFCNWLREIDLVSEALHGCVDRVMQFHGSSSESQRAEVISSFMDPDSTESMVMVIQVDAGGTGLNLQAAKKVYMLSPHWNATSEMQAMSRAHRVNTPHPVEVTRFVMAGSIEEYMHNKQQKKLIVASTILNDPRLRSALASSDGFELTYEDAASLFQSAEYDDLVSEMDDDDDDDDESPVVEVSVTCAGDILKALAAIAEVRDSLVEPGYTLSMRLSKEGGNAILGHLGSSQRKMWNRYLFETVAQEFAEKLAKGTLCGDSVVTMVGHSTYNVVFNML